MRFPTRVNISSALIIALLGLAIVESTAVASQLTRKHGAQDTGAHAASALSKSVRRTPPPRTNIVVRRKGSPTLVFTDDSAIAFHLALTREEIRRIEAALAKDLAHGCFRARHTRRVVAAGRHLVAASSADELVMLRRELSHLKAALGVDLANGDFRGPHTRREVAGGDRSFSLTGGDELADGAVSVSDDIRRLEMAVEQDLHAGDFRAIETHFAIDGRRWKVD